MSKVIWYHFRNFLIGMGSSIEISPSRNYVRPGSDGFRRDRLAMRKDHAKVGKDVRNAVKSLNG